MDWNTEAAGVLNTPQMQHLAPGGRELQHFLARENIDFSSCGDHPGVRGVNAVDVRIDFANISPKCCGQGDGGEVRPTTTERRHLVPSLRPALESCNDWDFAMGQTSADAVGPDIRNVCLAVDVVGYEASRTSGKSAGQLAKIRQRDRQQGR